MKGENKKEYNEGRNRKSKHLEGKEKKNKSKCCTKKNKLSEIKVIG